MRYSTGSVTPCGNETSAAGASATIAALVFSTVGNGIFEFAPGFEI
jgi:hypothetical protein